MGRSWLREGPGDGGLDILHLKYYLLDMLDHGYITISRNKRPIRGRSRRSIL